MIGRRQTQVIGKTSFRALTAVVVMAAVIAGGWPAQAISTVHAASAPPPISRTRPAAIVAGTYISGADYADTVQRVRITVTQQPQTPGQATYTETQIRSSAITILIDAAVAQHYASQHGLSVTAAEVQKQFDTTRARFSSAKAFDTALKANGLTATTYKQLLATQLIQQKVAVRIAPPPTTVEEVQARHILVASKALAQKLYDQLRRDPKQFAALAKKYSTDTVSGAQGGELGFFGRGAMVPSFEQAAFSQKVGQIGAPVHSQYGYHIIQVEAHKQVPYAQAGQAVQQSVLHSRSLIFQQWLHAERLRDHVRILIPGVSLTS